jgi:hypothetical protein
VEFTESEEMEFGLDKKISSASSELNEFVTPPESPGGSQLKQETNPRPIQRSAGISQQIKDPQELSVVGFFRISTLVTE